MLTLGPVEKAATSAQRHLKTGMPALQASDVNAAWMAHDISQDTLCRGTECNAACLCQQAKVYDDFALCELRSALCKGAGALLMTDDFKHE